MLKPHEISSTKASSVELQAIGFFSVIELQGIGLCGGLLVLNCGGRPLEFHCTLPVVPERAQEILYGNSLRPFLHSELIGPALLERAKSRFELLLIDQKASLGLATPVSPCVGWVPAPDSLAESNESKVESEPYAGIVAARSEQQGQISQWLGQLNMDIHEPFQRIQSAIQEAHSANRAA